MYHENLFLSLLITYLLRLHDAVLLSPSGFDLKKWDPSQIIRESALLPDASRAILLGGLTEKSYTGRYLDGQRYNLKDEGIYVCALGGLPLFRSEHKFVSGTGWPSFYDVFDDSHLIQIIEPNGATEVICARSGCHIGHVFPDTPPPALQRKFLADGITKYDKKRFFRFCVNAGALQFIPREKLSAVEGGPSMRCRI
jgi:peptide-methionine (R)-S-oxide reductase